MRYGPAPFRLEGMSRCRVCGVPKLVTRMTAERANGIAVLESELRRHETEHCGGGGPTVHNYNPLTRQTD